MERTEPAPSALKLTALQMRIEAAREAVKRGRLAFLVATILSLSVIVSLYNSYLSWYRGFALQTNFASNEVTRQAQIFLLDEWVKNQTIAIQPLGMRVGTSDVAFLGSASLFICSLWFFFCVRRQNHVIGLLLADTDEEPREILNLVYHGISSHLVFLDTTGSDQPIASLEPSFPAQGKGIPFVRGSVKLLYLLPGITIFLCVIFDTLTIFLIEAPFRFPHKPLAMKLSANDTIWILVFEIAAIILGTLSCVMSARVIIFENGTEKLLREYHAILRKVERTPVS